MGLKLAGEVLLERALFEGMVAVALGLSTVYYIRGKVSASIEVEWEKLWME